MIIQHHRTAVFMQITVIIAPKNRIAFFIHSFMFFPIIFWKKKNGTIPILLFDFFFGFHEIVSCVYRHYGWRHRHHRRRFRVNVDL